MSILYGTDQFPPTTPSRLIWPKSPPSAINTLINNIINADKNTLKNNVINADKNGPLSHPMINV